MSADVLADWAVEGVRAARMLVAHSGPEALEMTGRERLMPRYLNETDTAYAARLQDAWDLWAAAGTKAGMLAQFAAAGWSGLKYFTATDWPLTTVADWWSQWFLFFPEGTHSWSGPPIVGTTVLVGSSVVGPGTIVGSGAPAVGSGITAGSSATVDEVQRVRRIISTWKAGHEVCRRVVIEVSAPTVGSGVTVGAPTTVGGEVAGFKGTSGVPNTL